MDNAILGYGRTITNPANTDNPQIQLVLCPFDSNNKPIYAESWLKTVNVTDLAGLPVRGELELDSNGPCNSILIGSEKASVEPLFFNPLNCEVLPLHQVPEASNWFRKYSNNAFQELGFMNVLVVRSKNVRKPFLIPCVAIAQYYLPHLMLLKMAIKQIPFKSDLYEENNSILKPPHVRIKLRDKVPGKIAVHLARFLVDRYASSVLSEIQKRSMHTLDGRFASFYMKPPIDQPTEWSVSCVDVNDAYLIRQIISCTAEFPFTKFTYEQDKIVFYGEGTKPQTRHRKKQVTKDAKLALGKTSNADTEETEITSVVVSRYPSLQNVALSSKTEKIPKERKNKIKFLIRHVRISIATGPNGFEMEHGRASITNIPDCDTHEQLPDEVIQHHRLAKFFNLLVFLQQQYETEFIILSQCKPTDSTNGENVIPYDPFYFDNIWHRKCKIVAREKNDRIEKWKELGRRFYLVKCTTPTFVAYIIEFVPGFYANDSASTLLLYSRSSIAEDEIYAEIKSYCRNRKSWPVISSQKKFQAQKLYHNDNETEAALALRILKLGAKTLSEKAVI